MHIPQSSSEQITAAAQHKCAPRPQAAGYECALRSVHPEVATALRVAVWSQRAIGLSHAASRLCVADSLPDVDRSRAAIQNMK